MGEINGHSPIPIDWQPVALPCGVGKGANSQANVSVAHNSAKNDRDKYR